MEPPGGFLTHHQGSDTLSGVGQGHSAPCSTSATLMNPNKNRIYVFLDAITGKEKECNETTAITLMGLRQYINGQARFRFLRSFIPKITETKTITRKDAGTNEKRKFEGRISKVQETDVSTTPPRLRRSMGPGGPTTKLDTTWLEPLSGAELPEAPEMRKIGQ